ncbi:MAG: cyclic nucleotide-binding domain-containing protein [Myxococcales bacterium]|nr:cyclic nucleotide-binding domain-containing protein [Myxococcales bacterium]
MAEQKPVQGAARVAADARAAAAEGNAIAARAAWRRLVAAEPANPVWRLRLAAADPQPEVALEACVTDALAADHPLAALGAALAAGLSDLPARFADYLQGSPRLGRGAPPLPPLATPAVPAVVSEAELPAWPQPVAGHVTPLPLLSSLDAKGFEAVVPALSRVALDADQVLLAEGSAATALYLLAGGELEVVKAHATRGLVSLGRLRAGSVVGEMALVLDRARSATVRAVTDVELIRVELDALEAVAERRPAVRDALTRFTHDRVLATLVGTSPLFTDLDQADRGAVLWRFEHRDAATGEVIMAEGEAPAGLHLVVTGEVAVSRQDHGVAVPLARLGPGSVFGEIGLISGRTSATVTAARATELLRLAPNDFKALCEEHPAIRIRTAALADARVAENRFIFEDDEFIEAAD